MPKSRTRKKEDFTPPPEKKTEPVKLDGLGRRWVAPLMLGLFLVGLVWIVVFYVTGAEWPVGALHNWNILVGIGFIALGFAVSTQWK